MILSMTGCGRGEATGDYGRVIAEVSSVNSKYLDINLRLPSLFGPIVDHKLRDIINRKLGRGRINVHITVELSNMGERQPLIDTNLARVYAERMNELALELGMQTDVTFTTIARMPGVINMTGNEADTALNDGCETALGLALCELENSRMQEGEKLATDIRMRMQAVRELAVDVDKIAPGQILDAKNKLAARLEEISTVSFDQTRLEQEMAVLAERLDITEERVRLKAHLVEMENILAKGGRIGRKLDFLLQEILREWNTLSNKSANSSINHIAVQAKDELEKVREQVQNIE